MTAIRDTIGLPSFNSPNDTQEISFSAHSQPYNTVVGKQRRISAFSTGPCVWTVKRWPLMRRFLFAAKKQPGQQCVVTALPALTTANAQEASTMAKQAFYSPLPQWANSPYRQVNISLLVRVSRSQ